MIKKTLLAILLTSIFANASESKSNCTVTELEKEKSHFCIIKEENDFYIKDTIRIVRNYPDLNSETMTEQYRIEQKIDNIPEELFNKKIKFKNENGLAVLITEDGDFYTTRIGYEQQNGHYLEIKNNIIEEFKLEEVKNVKKFISKHNLYALDGNNKLWKKENNKWFKFNISNVYDFIYKENGIVYILSDHGVYYGNYDDNIEEFKLMEIIIDENLYKNKESKEDYKNKIIKEIFNEKTKLKDAYDRYYNYREDTFYFENINEKNSENYHIITKNEIIIKEIVKNNNPDQAICDTQPRIPNISIDKKINNYINEKEIEMKKSYSVQYHHYFSTYEKNIVDTKYNGIINFKNKEQVVIDDIPEREFNMLESILFMETKIIKSFKEGNYIFILRDNGRLTIKDIETDEVKILYQVNNIEKDKDIKILIDPKLESFEKINEIKLMEIEEVDKSAEVFLFKFKDIKSLEHENIKEKISLKFR